MGDLKQVLLPALGPAHVWLCGSVRTEPTNWESISPVLVLYWSRPSLELQVSIPSSIWVAGAQSPSVVFHCFPRPLARSWIRREAARTRLAGVASGSLTHYITMLTLAGCFWCFPLNKQHSCGPLPGLLLLGLFLKERWSDYQAERLLVYFRSMETDGTPVDFPLIIMMIHASEQVLMFICWTEYLIWLFTRYKLVYILLCLTFLNRFWPGDSCDVVVILCFWS